MSRPLKKLIIQIPCFNEAETLAETVRALPRAVVGMDVVEFLVIDDGSTDGTADLARNLGVHHVVRHTTNRGLARAFSTGLDASLRVGADIIVNTDADNQYDAGGIPDLIRPILQGEADMVVGDRQTGQIAHFSWTKRRLQSLGSWVVRQASGTSVPDATSGFRAISRAAAMKLNVVSDFTYTLETIIQARHKNIAVSHVPVRTNKKTRESRLFRSIRSYVSRSIVTIFRIYMMYRPMRVFVGAGIFIGAVGVLLGLRFLYFFLSGNGSGHVQSLLLAVLLLVVGFQTCMTGFLADLMGANRRLMEEVLWRVRRMEVGTNIDPLSQSPDPTSRSGSASD